MTQCEGCASGHIRTNPPAPDTKMVVLIWVMIVAWAVLSIVVIGVLISTRNACLAPPVSPLSSSLADWQAFYLDAITKGGK